MSRITGSWGLNFLIQLFKSREQSGRFRAVGDKWQIVHGWLRDRLED
jgi:hypothetical protein